jgi:hypothetical protein
MRVLLALPLGYASGTEGVEEYVADQWGKASTGESMRDIAFIGITLIFFMISIAYVYACGRLR